MSGSLPPADDGAAPRLAPPPDEARSATLWVGLINIAQFAVKLVRGAVIPKVLPPARYGLFNSVTLALRYGQYADLGMIALMGKQLPAALAREGSAGLERRMGIALTWLLLASGSIGLVVAALALGTRTDGWFYRVAFPVAGATILAQKLNLLLGERLRAEERFRTLSIGAMTWMVGGTLLAILGVLTFDVLGLVASLIGAELLWLGYLLRATRLPAPRRLDWAEVKANVIGGGMLLGMNVGELVLATLDQVFVLQFYSRAQFGMYSLGLFISTTLLALSGIFLTLTQPKIMKLVATGDDGAAHALVDRAMTAYLLLVALPLPIGYLLIDVVIHGYLPAYREGMGMYFLVTGMALYRGPLLILQPYFIARGEERLLLSFYAVAITLGVAMEAVVVHWGGPVELVLLVSMGNYLILAGLILRAFERRGVGPRSMTKYATGVVASATVAAFYLSLRATAHGMALGGRLVVYIPALLFAVAGSAALLVVFRRQARECFATFLRRS